jgi:hypothetical protein
MRIVHLNKLADLNWLCDTHLKNLSPPAFRSCMLHGNEDCPDKLELYDTRDPLITTKPVIVYLLQEDLTYKPQEP